MKIRSATDEDLPRVLEIESLSFPNRKRWEPDDVREAMKDLFLLADENGISGYLIACCREATGTGVILRIAVHPDRRNRGIATRLIEAALGKFSEQELQEAEIDVEIVKRGAIRVYENLGFRTVRGIPMSGNDSMNNENGSFYIMKRDLRREGEGMERPYRCPVCNAPLEEDKDAGFKIPPQCPYVGTVYPELCALHDKLYFGRWRKMDADPNDIRRAFAKLGRLFSKTRDAVEREGVKPGRRNLREAEDALAAADPAGEPYSSVKFMDQALSWIHHALNDLLQEKRAKLHSPADYERHYDVILPFREDW